MPLLWTTTIGFMKFSNVAIHDHGNWEKFSNAAVMDNDNWIYEILMITAIGKFFQMLLSWTTTIGFMKFSNAAVMDNDNWIYEILKCRCSLSRQLGKIFKCCCHEQRQLSFMFFKHQTLLSPVQTRPTTPINRERKTQFTEFVVSQYHSVDQEKSK